MSAGRFQPLFTQISESADMVLLAGDLTDTGQPEEARILARELTALRVPGSPFWAITTSSQAIRRRSRTSSLTRDSPYSMAKLAR